MKAVLRLIYTYFASTPAQRVFSAIGVLLIVCSYVMLRVQPQTTLLGVLALSGATAFFLGSGMMPLTFGRLARSHSAKMLPDARLKLLISALVTVMLVAVPLPFLFVSGMLTAIGPPNPHPTAAQIAQFHLGIQQTFWSTYGVIVILIAWLYVALWFITSQRNTVGFLKGLIVIAVVVLMPTRNIVNPQVLMWLNLAEAAATLLVFSALFLCWPHLPAIKGPPRIPPSAAGHGEKRTRIRGREIDLLLGTSNPWLLAIGQLVPVLLAARIGFYSAAVWLFYLTTFSTVAGAIAGQAAGRSRTLWLRGDWSTTQLFLQVERSFWRHNNYVLAILIILMVAIGSYAELPVTLLATGVPLLILGTVLSTYLGLMLTRGLRWGETILAVAVMVALMAVAVLAARSDGALTHIITLEFVLALAAVALRFAARRRWANIDWMQCRLERSLSGRSAT